MTRFTIRLWLLVLALFFGISAGGQTLPTGSLAGCTLSGSTYTCGNLSYANDTTFTLTANTTINVTGDFSAEKNLSVVTNGFTLTLTATRDIDLKKNVALNATVNITADRDVKIAKDTVISGNITAGRDVILGNNTNITGNVNATDKLTVGSGTINGSCTYASTNYTCTGQTVSVAAASVTEGNSGTTTAAFAVTLNSASSTGAVMVNYATSNGTATGGACGAAGVDYATTTGTATIPIGATSTTFTVRICGDTSIEVDETFTVTLSAPVNATLGSPRSATGTITNDDVCACVPKNGNLIANPDFEELCASTIIENFGVVNGGTVNMRNGVCGWVMNGRGMETWENTTTTPASKGTVFVEIDGYSDTVDCLSQNIVTSAGIDYTLKVDYRARTSTKEGLIVKWNGIQKYSTTSVLTSAWQTITVTGLTAIGNDRIEFCEPSASNNSLGSWIDNVRVQTFFPDHYEVSVPSSNVACLASTVKVTACADSSRPCTNALPTPSMPTANLATNAGTLASGALTLSAGGIVTTTLSYPSAADGGTAILTLSGESVPGANARTCCIGSACSTADTCVATFKTAGFIFANTATGASATLPIQTAGTSSGTTYLRAVQTNTATGACMAALTNPSAVTLGYTCNNPTTCSTGNYLDITPYNGSTALTLQTVAAAGSTVNLYFDATNGSAPLTFNYRDVGQITLNASKAAGGTLLTALSGSSNPFVVKPGGFSITGVKQTAAPQLANPGAVDATGAKFVKAGEAFTATVSAVTSAGAVTPNFGRETSAEGALLTHALVAPSGGVPGVLSNGTIAGGSFSSGIATVTNLSWNEVGIISLTPSVADGNYLGAGNTTETAAANVGRFIPDHFSIAPGTVVAACTTHPAASGSYTPTDFTFFSQPNGFSTPFTLKALNGASPPAPTKNYAGAFARISSAGWAWSGTSSATGLRFGTTAALPAGAALAGAYVMPVAPTPVTLVPVGTWGNGEVILSSVMHQISRPTALTNETLVTVTALPVDADGVTLPAAVAVGSPTAVRYGRLRLLNAYGSERLALPVPLLSEYRNGGNWVRNTDDSCTSILAPTSVAGLSFNPEVAANVKGNHLSSGETTATVSGTGRMVAGDGQLRLSAPGLNNDGYLNISIPLALMPWLKFPVGSDPTARATFGIYKSPLIYRRENY